MLFDLHDAVANYSAHQMRVAVYVYVFWMMLMGYYSNFIRVIVWEEQAVTEVWSGRTLAYWVQRTNLKFRHGFALRRRSEVAARPYPSRRHGVLFAAPQI